MGLSDTDKKALESSWKTLTAGADGKKNAGINLVLWMFQTIPNMRAQFSKFDATQSDAALRGDAEFVKQVTTIVTALDNLMNSLNNAGALQAGLTKLADAHKKISIGLEFFTPLQQNIHSFVEKALGVGAGSDEAKAWTNLIATFNDVLKA